jgi:hypothetical protein
MDAGVRILEHQACGKRGCPCAASLRRGRGLTHCIHHKDPWPSLNVRVRDGKLLVRCFATCPQLDLIQSLREHGLWPDNTDNPDRLFQPPPQLILSQPVITRHPYYDQNGHLVAVHVRKDFGNGRKSMPWELPDGRSSQNGDINTANLPLYGLPFVLERLDKVVILVEGEKAADAAMAEGLVAVSLSGGANQPDFGTALESLRGRDVLLWPDNDQPGLDLMLRVRCQLEQIAQRVRWLTVPGLPDKGDAADYFTSDRTIDELRNYVVPEPPVHDHGLARMQPERRFRLLTATELKRRPDPDWLVNDTIQQDTLALIVGAPESFKTFVALDMALSIAEGLSWQGHPCKQGPAVYVSAEGGSGLGLRVSAWEQARDVDVEHCYFLPDQAPQFLDRSRDGDVEELLLSLLDMREQPAFIVIDTLARVMVGHDENSVEHMGVLIATADRIRQATGATVTFVHHNNKQGSARGSTSLLGAVHTIVECSRESGARFVVVKCGKQKDADHFPTMTLESRQIVVGASGERDRERSSLVLDLRVSALFNAGGTPRISPSSRKALEALITLDNAGRATWWHATDQPKTTFDEARKQLIAYRYVDHIVDYLGNAVYQPTDLGRTQGRTGSDQGRMDPGGPMDGEEVGGSENRVGWEGPLKGRAPTDPSDLHDPVHSFDRLADLPWA